MIDPYYRTFEGFRILFLKEWVYFGHNFPRYLDLCNSRPEDFCPVIVLFLDCVNQLLSMNEVSFEFSHAFILELSSKLFKCLYFEMTEGVERYEMGTQKKQDNEKVFVSAFEEIKGKQF